MRFARVLEEHASIDSTNQRAKVLAKEGAPHGSIVVAHEQTAGRGQHGRLWWSPRGAGLYVSYVLRPELRAAESPLITLAAAVAVSSAIGTVVGIKWPNDILARSDRRKVAGVLVEGSSAGDRVDHVVIGIGVNVREVERPAHIAARATSLEALGASLSLESLTDALEQATESLCADGPGGLLEAFCARAIGLHEQVEFDGLTGILEGVARDGALIVGGRKYYSGTLKLEGDPAHATNTRIA